MEDVARDAGVSLATVDRVINRRPGVRQKTVARVEAAIARLSYRPDPLAARLARNRTFRFCFVLPRGSNTFMSLLEEQVRHASDWLASQRADTDIVHADTFDPEALAGALDALGSAYDGVATIALDHPRVRAAIDDLSSRGVAVVTLVSDAPSSRRLHYAGIDNTAAGRTAGTLMGRFLAGRSGRVGVIAGSLALRDHAERHFGFAQVMGGEYPGLTLLPVREGRDDRERTEAIARQFLADTPDLVGLYSIGAGNRGIGAALEASGRADDIVFIGHDLTPFTRRFLVRGVMDAVINQDAGHEARSAARVLMAHCWGEPVVADQERIRIDIFIRDNLP
nr:LacI family DNA-binding transcriptional regulator [Alsobacter ponti]